MSGEELAEYRLDIPPLFDAMAGANGCVYMTTEDSRLLCMGKEE